MVLMVAFIILSVSYYVFSEDITITTYYPSPYGSYRELRAQNVSIGENYSAAAYCWPPAICTHSINNTADLIVEGRVGFGTFVPQNMLDVNGTIVVGGNFSGNNTFIAPADSILVEGGIGINRTDITAGVDLDVNGTINATSYWADGAPGWNGTIHTTNGLAACEVTVINGIIANTSAGC